jgi:hypothetical protein
MSKKKPFLTVMSEIRDMDRKDVIDELSMHTDMNGGIRCPVPGCTCTTVFKRWGDMRGHFLDSSTHKKDYFKAYLAKQKEPFCDPSGPEFNHGINSLMLALIRQPTALKDMGGEKASRSKATTPSVEPAPVEAPARPKRARPVQEQQSLLPEAPKAQEPVQVPSQNLLEQVREEAKATPSRTGGKGAFSQVSEYIRDSDEINKVWRGKVWDEYVDMFHGIPPCFHCRSEEGKQIHHQNPLFHEIILLSLNKQGTTAEMIIEERDKGNQAPLNNLLQEVFAYHMKQGKVCAVPYCAGCNQDAEIKRRRGKAAKGE